MQAVLAVNYRQFYTAYTFLRDINLSWPAWVFSRNILSLLSPTTLQVLGPKETGADVPQGGGVNVILTGKNIKQYRLRPMTKIIDLDQGWYKNPEELCIFRHLPTFYWASSRRSSPHFSCTTGFGSGALVGERVTGVITYIAYRLRIVRRLGLSKLIAITTVANAAYTRKKFWI